jgi:hypothetical protein
MKWAQGLKEVYYLIESRRVVETFQVFPVLICSVSNPASSQPQKQPQSTPDAFLPI